MADNVAITAGIGTTIATDQIGGAHYQWMKVGFGVDGSVTFVNAANGLPVEVVAGTVIITGPAASAPVFVSPGLKTTEQLTRAAISCASSGDNTIVAASGSNKCRIYAMLFTVATPVAVKIGEGGPTYWTGAMTFGSGGGLVLGQQGEPHFMTSAVNKTVLINLSAAVQCSGVVWYTLVP